LDNLASVSRGVDENSSKDWSPVNSWLLELRFAGITTVLLHHVGKGGEQRGTSAREDNIDTSIILKRPMDYSPEDGCRFLVTFSKARVSLADAQLIADTEFRLTEDEHGRTVWVWANAKRETKRQILKMIVEGVQQEAIREALGVTKGYVSRIKAEAIKQGYLSTKGELTQSGYTFIHG
jgi:putative DNA primase/helicase